MLICYVLRYVFTFWEMLRFAALGTAKRKTILEVYVMRDPHLRFEYYAVKIIITICVNLLRFASCFYVLGNVTFCGPAN